MGWLMGNALCIVAEKVRQNDFIGFPRAAMFCNNLLISNKSFRPTNADTNLAFVVVFGLYRSGTVRSFRARVHPPKSANISIRVSVA